MKRVFLNPAREEEERELQGWVLTGLTEVDQEERARTEKLAR